MGAVIAALILCRMNMNLIFFIASILLGVGLAMDAFAISIANGISRPDAKCRYVMKVTAVYAFFQFAMPMIGWIMCFIGMRIGTKVGELFSAHAAIVGGVILVIIGIEVIAKDVLL